MRLIMKLIPAVAVSSLLAACGSSSSSSSSPSASVQVIFKGLPLYTFVGGSGY